jgi:multiple antibiotic resistance protein
MKEVLTFFATAFVSLFTIINPFSTASVFHALTKKGTKQKNKKIAKKATIIAISVLVIFVFLGDFILKIFNISIEAFKIASGVLVFGIGYGMISKGKHSSIREDSKSKQKDDISIIPLAIPMLSGPGAMATALVLMENSKGNPLSILSIVFSIVVICLFAYFLLIEAHKVDKYLGKTGTIVIDKILGLIVVVIGIQFIVSGLKGIFPGLS